MFLHWMISLAGNNLERSVNLQNNNKAAEEGLVNTCLHKMELLLLASAHIPPLRITTARFNQN